MGLKNAGFPDFRFNPLGFKKSGSLIADLIACGLLSLNEPEIDKIDYESRPAKQALEIIGDGVSYIELIGFENEPLSYVDATTGLTVNTNWDVSAQFLIPTNGIAFLTTAKAGIAYHLDPTFRQSNAKYPLTTELGNGPIYAQQEFSPAIPTQVILTEESLADTQGYTVAIRNEVDNYEYKNGTSPWSGIDSIVDDVACKIATAQYQGITQNILARYNTTDTFLNWAIVQADTTDVQFSVQTNLGTESEISHSGSGEFEDLYYKEDLSGAAGLNFALFRVRDERPSGWTEFCVSETGSLNLSAIDRAKGTSYASMTAEQVYAEKDNILALQLFEDVTALIPFETEQIIPNFLNSSITIGFDKEGLHPTAQYSKRIKYDRVVCDIAGTPTGGAWESGAYIRWADLYNGIFITDLNDITTDHLAGTNKILAHDDMANITLQQQWVSEDKQQILWTSEPIERHSECDSKFRKFLSMNEQFYVQTFEGSGIYEPYLVDDGTGTFVPFMVLKDWVEVIE